MQEGLLVWAHSYCRSTLAFYEGLAKAFDVPVRFLMWIGSCANRTAVGYAADEFKHLDIVYIGDDRDTALKEMAGHSTWHHVFGTYQKGTVFREMLVEARRRGAHVAVASEAPCNMSRPPGRYLKEMYLSCILRYVVTKQVRAADFFLNFSGNDSSRLRRLGWPSEKLVNCGYYSPPLFGSSCVMRDRTHWEKFTVLMTGRPEWHRDPMLLLEAIRLLRERGMACRAVITQQGPLLTRMQRYAARHQLDVSFVGLVPYDRLLKLYQECSCFAATGRAEPWGIRVNDALHCGAPLIVSNGMGAEKLVRDHECGLTFPAGAPAVLADRLQALIRSQETYLQFAEAACLASAVCLPANRAKVIAKEIRDRFPGWE